MSLALVAGARWGGKPPGPVAAGSTIIGETDELHREAAKLLKTAG